VAELNVNVQGDGLLIEGRASGHKSRGTTSMNDVALPTFLRRRAEGSRALDLAVPRVLHRQMAGHPEVKTV
jgi:hypothetical protein